MNDQCELCPAQAEFEYVGRNLCSACVSKEAAKVERPDKAKEKIFRNKGKRINEVPAKETYSGEASPYWNDIKSQSWQPENNQLSECPEANPDVLPESASLYAYDVSEDEELRADVIRDVVAELTTLQREALALCEAPGYTEEKAAEKLGLTRRAFRTIIDRVKETIERKIKQRQASARWQK